MNRTTWALRIGVLLAAASLLGGCCVFPAGGHHGYHHGYGSSERPGAYPYRH
jgi:hypothetical protein